MILEVHNLVKQYPDICAVSDVSISIAQGICFGLLGSNGAGKTTTVEMLEGLTEPTSGEILYKGRQRDEQYQKEMGIMFQSTALQDYITVIETLKLFSSLYDTTVPINTLIESCDLGDILTRDSGKLSGGQKQRLLLSIALVNDPQIVFLDEPTTGLDPLARKHFWHVINNLRKQGKTIVLTTHYMEEAYTLCDYLVFMEHGKVIAEGRPQNLLNQHFSDSVIALATKDVPVNLEIADATITRKDDSVEIVTSSVEKALHVLKQKKISLNSIRIRSRTLEELFFDIAQREKT